MFKETEFYLVAYSTEVSLRHFVSYILCIYLRVSFFFLFFSVNHVDSVSSCTKCLIESAQIIDGCIAYATTCQTIEI